MNRVSLLLSGVLLMMLTGCASLQEILSGAIGGGANTSPVRNGILQAAQSNSMGLESDALSDIESRYKAAVDAINPAQYSNPDAAKDEQQRLSTAEETSSVVGDWLKDMLGGETTPLETYVQGAVLKAVGSHPPVILPVVDKKYGVAKPVVPPGFDNGTISVDGRGLGQLRNIGNGIVVRRDRVHEMQMTGQSSSTCKVSFSITVSERSPKSIRCQ